MSLLNPPKKRNFNLDKLVKEFYEDLYKRVLQEMGYDTPPQEAELVVKDMLNNTDTEIKNICAELDRVNFLMPSGRINEQLAQVQIKPKEFDSLLRLKETEKNKTRPIYRLLQEIFPQKTLNNYQKTEKNLILKEHKDWIYLSQY